MWSCDLGYLDIAHNLRAILEIINSAHHINVITIRPHPRPLIGNDYSKDLVAYVKGLDLLELIAS